MRPDFCALILTHGRPDRVVTLTALESHGYTGPTFLVVDDEDATADEYRRLHGERVVMFSKAEAEKITDACDNFEGRRGVVYARNAAWDVAKRLGFRYFVVLDDDYNGFYYRFDGAGRYGAFKLEPLDWLFSALADYLAATPFVTLAISQGGDHIGGGESKSKIGTKRKAMNLFVCDTERPFRFSGRINEDVNAYVGEQRRGLPFLTIMGAQVNQRETQSNPGGLTEIYLDVGTYVKSFYSVVVAPSCVKVASLGDPRVEGTGHRRLHHLIDWNAAAPCIIEERYRRGEGEKAPPPPPVARATVTEDNAAQGIERFTKLIRAAGIKRADAIAAIAGSAIKHVQKDESPPPSLQHLFERWYGSLRSGAGNPDYGVYAATYWVRGSPHSIRTSSKS